MMGTEAGRPANDVRLERIEAVTDIALAHLGLEELLAELLDRVRDLLQVDTAVVLLLDQATNELVATAGCGLEEEVRQGFRLPVGIGFAGRVAAERRAVRIEHVDDTNVVNPILLQKGVRSVLGVPMLVSGELIGVMHVGTLTPRWFFDDDVELLQLVADRIALAIQAHLSALDRAAAAALKRSLLPSRLPRVPGVEIAARYLPGEQSGVGGDWYDVFVLPSGWLGVVVGDVVGRGVRAAVVMGRLRSALRAYALDYDDPADVLERLDRKVQHFETDMMATVLYAIFEPTFERMHVSVAGHLMPVVAAPGRPAALLDVPVDAPVGVGSRLKRRTTLVEMPVNAVLCFYTDGLVERPGRSLDEGIDRLRRAVKVGPAETVCAAVISQLIGSDSNDDVALLMLRRQMDSAGPDL
jgi:sigma-B regulation protein RsbU (phosphoserine phosphatase)